MICHKLTVRRPAIMLAVIAAYRRIDQVKDKRGERIRNAPRPQEGDQPRAAGNHRPARRQFDLPRLSLTCLPLKLFPCERQPVSGQFRRPLLIPVQPCHYGIAV
jgi:hypothetical protein